MVASPAMWTPLLKASEIEITSRTEGRIAMTGGYGSYGEPVRCKRKKSGEMTELWLSAGKLVSEDHLAAEMIARYEPLPSVSSKRRQSKRSGKSDR